MSTSSNSPTAATCLIGKPTVGKGQAVSSSKQPEAGSWKVMIDGSFVTHSRTPYALSIVQTSPRNGALVTDDTIRHHDSGSTWTVGARPAVFPAHTASDLVSIAFVEAPRVYSLHEPEDSKRPFVLLRRHEEPVLVGLLVAPVDTPAEAPGTVETSPHRSNPE